MNKIFTFCLLLTGLFGTAQDGVPDITFGTNGKSSVSLSGAVGPDFQKLVTLSNNQLLQVFAIDNGTDYDFGLARFREDGSLDTDFGSGGYVMTDFGGSETATSLMVLSGNKILVGGFSVNASGNSVFAMARYHANGSLDASFGSGGKVTTAIGTDDYAYSLNLQPDGKILLAGYARIGTAYRFAMSRYLPANGALDGTFGTAGTVTTSFSGVVDAAYATVVQNDGNIVLAGYSSNGTTSSFAVARYLAANGALDPSFDGDGKATVSIHGNWDVAQALTVQLDGSVVLGGYTTTPEGIDLALARLTPAGALDLTFNGTGKQTTRISTGTDMIYSIAQQSDGKYIVSGHTFNGTDDDFIVARYLPNGQLDDQFGVGNLGYTILDFSGNDYGYSISSQNSKLLIGGTTGTSLALARVVNSSVLLPVSLMQFIAARQQNTVVLNWKTAQEQNTVAFEVQRSADGLHYTTIASVKAAGNSGTVSDYSAVDKNPLPSVNFYRIRIINGDGSSTFSRSVAIRFDGKASSLQAFPNPVSNSLHLQVNLAAGRYEVEMLDVTGRKIRRSQLQSHGAAISASIDMTGLQKGIYFIRVGNETIRVIKDR